MTFLSGTTDGTIIIQSPNALVFGTGNASTDVYLKEIAGGLSISQPLTLPSTGIINPGGSPVLVAKADLTAQAANAGSTLLYAVPANGAGMYRISAYVVVTQQATVSATMPSVVVAWTDADTNSGTSATFTPPSGAANPAVGVSSASSTAAGVSVGVDVIQVKASTNIQYSTTGYASSGATPMQYAIHVKLEYLGA